jgi:uncharacterized protein (TIGR02145 family)
MKLNRFLFTASVALAMASIFSCSSAGDGVGDSSFLEESFGSINKEGADKKEGTGLCSGFADGTTREHYGKEKKQFCDERDGAKYVYVTIGEQTWMAENLNYKADSSYCYGEFGAVDPAVTTSEIKANCTKYGRLYNWTAAMESCPAGWHLPSRAEWEALRAFVDPLPNPTECYGLTTVNSVPVYCDTLSMQAEWNFGGIILRGNKVAQHLKAQESWNNCGLSGTAYYLCEDSFGFAALGGGMGFALGFMNLNVTGTWWSAEKISWNEGNSAYAISIMSHREIIQFVVAAINHFDSVRCLKD